MIPAAHSCDWLLIYVNDVATKNTTTLLTVFMLSVDLHVKPRAVNQPAKAAAPGSPHRSFPALALVTTPQLNLGRHEKNSPSPANSVSPNFFTQTNIINFAQHTTLAELHFDNDLQILNKSITNNMLSFVTAAALLLASLATAAPTPDGTDTTNVKAGTNICLNFCEDAGFNGLCYNACPYEGECGKHNTPTSPSMTVRMLTHNDHQSKCLSSPSRCAAK